MLKFQTHILCLKTFRLNPTQLGCADAGVGSCIHLDTQRNYDGESTLEFSWSQEQTSATAMAGIL